MSTERGAWSIQGQGGDARSTRRRRGARAKAAARKEKLEAYYKEVGGKPSEGPAYQRFAEGVSGPGHTKQGPQWVPLVAYPHHLVQ